MQHERKEKEKFEEEKKGQRSAIYSISTEVSTSLVTSMRVSFPRSNWYRDTRELGDGKPPCMFFFFSFIRIISGSLGGELDCLFFLVTPGSTKQNQTKPQTPTRQGDMEISASKKKRKEKT